MLRRFIQSWRRRFRFKRGNAYRLCFLPEEPEAIAAGTIYVVGEANHHWAAVFKCPCGCGADVWLNLLDGHTPCWTFELDSTGRLSFSPSIVRRVGCRSHFFIWENRVYWAYPRTDF